MKKNILLLCLISISLFGNNFKYIEKEPVNNLLKEIKERNGLILTEEEQFTNKIKDNLINVFKIYKENRIINSLEYKRLENFTNAMNKDNIFEKDIDFKINNKNVSMKEMIYNIVVNLELKDLKFYLEKNGLNYIGLLFNPSSEAKEKFQALLRYVSSKEIPLNKDSDIISFENIVKYDALSIFDAYLRYVKPEISNENFLYFIANETLFKDYSRSDTYIRDVLYKKMNSNEIVSFEDSMISKTPFTEIKRLGLKGYYKKVYTVEVPFISYLLKANKEKVDYNEDIKSEYEKKYAMSNIKIKDEKVFVRLFQNNGVFYRELSWEDFKKRFINR